MGQHVYPSDLIRVRFDSEVENGKLEWETTVENINWRLVGLYYRMI